MTNSTERVARIAVAGVCGSGKTTIVDRLRQHGYDAYVVSQEHSIIRDLWKHQDPAALVFLDIRLETVRTRRNNDWPQWMYDLQQDRLADARAHATVTIETDTHSIDETVDLIIQALQQPG
jgi:broad-specificity NMP kinase